MRAGLILDYWQDSWECLVCRATRVVVDGSRTDIKLALTVLDGVPESTRRARCPGGQLAPAVIATVSLGVATVSESRKAELTEKTQVDAGSCFQQALRVLTVV